MKRTFILLVGVMAVVAVLFMNASEPEAGYGVGDYAADFKLPNIDGKMVSMSDYSSAKGFIIVFTCNTCPYAKAYESRIMDLDKKYAGKGFPVIAINPNDISQQPGDSMEEMKKRSGNKGYSFPYLRDDSQEVAKAFGATKTPHVYVLNKEAAGKYKVEFIGAIDDSPNDPSDVSETYVEDAIDAVMAGKSPAVTEKRAIGCTIKWKS
ncbi:MAG: thioredoxin family protein [Ekhidna sp.]|uniref:thioredoxin family protein n=1 Tax=Ekhidna sp. TaxID=2608089 RepID=UPI0032EC0BE8